VSAIAIGQGCFVSRRITDDDQPPRLVYRVAPQGPWDSGWRLLAGDEPADLSVPEQAIADTIAALCTRYPALTAVLTDSRRPHRPTAVWQWKQRTGTFIAVHAKAVSQI